MTRLIFLSLLAFTSTFVFSCGKSDTTTAVPKSSTRTSAGKKATLVLFGAPWCTECKNSFRKMKELLDGVPADQKEGLMIRLYVTTGAKTNDRPTQEIADKYLQFFGLTGDAHPDPWRWQNFKKMISQDNLVLPGAAVLDASGNVLKSYEAGPATFIDEEILKFALEKAK